MPSELWSDEEEDWSETNDDLEDSDPVPCPECGAEIYPDLDHCPVCGYWLTDADIRALGTGSPLSKTVRVVAIMMLAIFIAALVVGAIVTF